MAFSDLWRRDRKTQEHQGERGAYQGRPNYGGDDLGFDRRGWRTGSDYYGNNDDRYRARQGDDFEGEQHYRGSDEDWRTGSEQSGDYSDTRGESSFNDRWQNAYGPGIPSTGVDYTGRSADPGESASNDRNDERWWNDRAGWPNEDQQSRSFRGKGPRGYRRSDERIREEVHECLTDDHHVDASNIEVEVRDGEVTLTGNVDSRDQKRRAERLIEQLSGVVDVHNRLRVSSSGSDTPQPSV
ncbi:MAG: BON domain-containing protein [Povalibacter sp.]